MRIIQKLVLKNNLAVMIILFLMATRRLNNYRTILNTKTENKEFPNVRARWKKDRPLHFQKSNVLSNQPWRVL